MEIARVNYRLVYVVAWLTICGAQFAILAPLNVPILFGLVQHGQRATAAITQLDCGNHNRASYRFGVGRSRHSGTDAMPVNCEMLRIGDPIKIYYNTLDPTVSRAEEPKAALINELIAIGLACLLVPTGVVMVFWRWSANRRKEN